jgi:uncharacterized glyoxalase superfamily protein PhnB
MAHPKMIWPCINYRDAPAAGVYIATDDPAGIYRAATGAGVKVVRAPDPEAPARGFIVADPEGNLWSFGTYRGEGR